MDLITTLVLSVGFSITRALIKIWLKDYPEIEAGVSNLSDLLFGQTKDFLASRNGARKFEELGDRIAKNMEPIFLSFDENLEQASLVAIAKEVGQAIDNAKINTQLLVKINHQPSKLKEIIVNGYPDGYRMFSEIETQLYLRIIDISSQYIVDLSQHLPDYNKENFTEILIRLDTSLSMLNDILLKFDKLRETSEANKWSRKASDFEHDYRASIVRKYDKLELIGIDLHRSIKRYKLTISYVSLHLGSDNEVESVIGDSLEEKRISVSSAFDASKINLSYINKNLDRKYSVRISILGDAGSGKTTLIRWLAVHSAANDLGKEFPSLHNSIPFIITLRDYYDGLPAPEDFVKKIVPELAGQMPDQWVFDILRNRNALILVDGLDEVSYDKRPMVLDWLEDLVSIYPNAHYVITSRPTAFKKGCLSNLRFTEYRLIPMIKKEIEKFVEYWHDAVLIEHKLESKKISKRYSEKLLDQLRENLALMRLAANPLLCAIICALNYDRNMRLPAEKNKLYEACIEMLVDRIDPERGVVVDYSTKLTYRQKRVLLNDLAYWMIKNDYSSARIDLAKERLAFRIKDMIYTSEGEFVDNILLMLLERSGILRKPSYDSIDYVHKTFQEYMAACSIVEEGDWGIVNTFIDKDQWRDVTISAAGLANKHHANTLVSTIIKKAVEERILEKQAYYDLLAMSCLEVATEVFPDTKILAEARLNRLVPPKTGIQMRSLVSAGDLAAKFLRYHEEWKEEEIIACINTLGMGYSLTFLKALASYVNIQNDKVKEALLKVCDNIFPQDAYESGLSAAFLNILKSYAVHDNIHLDGRILSIVSLENFDSIRNSIPKTIKKLWINNYQETNSFFPNIFPDTEDVIITGEELPEIEILEQLENLHLLDLRLLEEQWPDLGDFSKLRKLKTLKIMSYNSSPNFYNLLSCPNLIDFGFFSRSTGYMDIEELGELAELKKITALRLGFEGNNFPDSSLLKSFTSLERIVYCTASSELICSSRNLYALTDHKLLKEIIINVPFSNQILDRTAMSFEIQTGVRVTVNEGWKISMW